MIRTLQGIVGLRLELISLSFSYVASRIGDSVLYNCSPEGTRLYYMENTAGRKLYNVVKYSDIM